MENENKTKKEIDSKLLMNIIIVVILIVGATLYTVRLSSEQQREISLQDWVELPVVWGDLGLQMIEAGVIDKEKFEALYASRGGLVASDKELLIAGNNGNLIIHSENSGM